jgi:polyferredoxin
LKVKVVSKPKSNAKIRNARAVIVIFLIVFADTLYWLWIPSLHSVWLILGILLGMVGLLMSIIGITICILMTLRSD